MKKSATHQRVCQAIKGNVIFIGSFTQISHRVLAMHIPVLNHQLVFCHGLHAHARSMVVLDAMKLIASDMVLLIL